MVDLFKRDILVPSRCCQRKRRVALIVGWGIVLWTLFFVVFTDMPKLIVDIFAGEVYLGQWVSLSLYFPRLLLFSFLAWVVIWAGGRKCCHVGRRPRMGTAEE